ncbi:glutamate receptor U1-like [Liolophura sinensis]|uniref:glutamate receptor U1-like n=1 Tax=Liolophura sinensis TaxID=3198878 RepID=UPI0031590B63
MAELRATTLAGFTKIRGFDHSGFPQAVEYGLYGIQYDSDSDTIGWLGTWRNDNGLQLPGGKLFANKFQSFGNRMITVTAREEDPFVIKHTEGNQSIFTGFAFDILDELSERLQFRYTVLEPEDARYGVQQEDGSWNGMIGNVIKGDIAMAVGPFAITSTREADVDFTTPFWEDSFGILTLKSQSETGKLFQMMKPFTTHVWVSIAAAMVVVALVSFLSSYYSPYTEWRRDSTNVSKKEASLKENFWIIYSSVIEQGPSFHPSGISSRCILGFWWLFTILIVSTYTANLAAFLTVVDVSSNINNLDELLAEREIGILLEDGGNIITVFKKSNNDLYKRVWEKIQQSPSVSGIDEALEYVKTGKYAYIGMKSILDHTAAKSCGTYAVSKETFNSGTFGLVIPENAPYREVASYNIMKMLEGGLVDNWQQRWWPKVYNCSGEQNARTGSATSLRLDSLGGLFIVYCAITAVGFVSLLLEIVIRRCNPPAPQK